jgi:hypothetical protein
VHRQSGELLSFVVVEVKQVALENLKMAGNYTWTVLSADSVRD